MILIHLLTAGKPIDAIPDEGYWNNPKVVESTFDDIYKAKFKSVCIPVTWTDHFASRAPHLPSSQFPLILTSFNTVSTAWMGRVEQVIHWALARGFWTVLNGHHDSWQWTDYPGTLPEFEILWIQIPNRRSLQE
ncbi:hypothetical protein BGX38DRAFT_1268143 [Terfezia claveryi]|nr:hypothetical protein BGX38DRAFT_1268143 [Terfezia claveryi]